MPPALLAMRPGILPRLSLELLGIRLFKESRQLRAELGKMRRKIVGSRNVRVLIDCGDPRLEDLFPAGEHKISEPSD